MSHFLLDPRETLIVGLNGQVAGLDPESGQEKWRNRLEEDDQGPVELAIVGDIVFACADRGQLYSIDKTTGMTRWRAPTSRDIGRSTILVEEEGGQPRRIFVAKGGVIDCFAAEGKRVWSQNLPETGVGSAAMAMGDAVRQADSEG